MKPIPTLAAMVAAIALLAACSTTPSVTDVPAAVSAARTAADHSRLAAYFDAKAKAYESEAAEHGRLALEYQRARGDAGVQGDARRPAPEVDPRAVAPRPDRAATLASHCRQLQSQFSSAAGEARALAQAHRELAASAPAVAR